MLQCEEKSVSSGGRRPDAMQMIGQQHPGNDFERPGLPGELNPLAQRRTNIVTGQKALPAERNHREKYIPHGK